MAVWSAGVRLAFDYEVRLFRTYPGKSLIGAIPQAVRGR